MRQRIFKIYEMGISFVGLCISFQIIVKCVDKD